MTLPPSPQGRTAIDPNTLRLPLSPTPRGGDKVTWYTNCAREEGIYVGHTPDGQPHVMNQHGFTSSLESFHALRFADPLSRVGPNWTKLTSTAAFVRPTAAELAKFDALLNRHFPPGPTYYELVEEIWNRGYEVFLVGGTVRDVLSSHESHDVDIVTTIPLPHAADLMARMYRRCPSMDRNNGFVRIGGEEIGEAFIDLKSFVCHNPGTADALFGADFSKDVCHRDFACNSVYYDPMNRVLIDPTGTGIPHAESRQLGLVASPTIPPFFRAEIVIRYMKFRLRGFNGIDETIQALRTQFAPALDAMTDSQIRAYIQRQLLNKARPEQYFELLDAFEAEHAVFANGTQLAAKVLPVIQQMRREL